MHLCPNFFFKRTLVVGLCCAILSCSVMIDSFWPHGPYTPPASSVHGDSPGKNTGVDSHALLQGIFPTQESNPGLQHFRQILYHLSHQGSPWILEWLAYPFSRGSSQPRNQTGISCIAGRFFTSWAITEALVVGFSSVQFSCSVMSDSLPPHELQHSRPPCPSPTPGVCSNSRPSSRWCHPAISSSVVPFSSCPQFLPSIRVFSNESTLHMKWPKYWSFSFSIIPSKEIPGLISSKMDWLDLLAVQGIRAILIHYTCILTNISKDLLIK